MRINIAEIKEKRHSSGKWRRIREMDNTETVVTRTREMGLASFHWKHKIRAFDTANVKGTMPHCRQAENDTHRPLIFHCTQT